ncbi:putative thioredoxin [Artomyces pyxidatus]|uniref:Thioredoxin n=1 Tax=Artomyces pyxidatus TaxID=48021 RepID=A0ACB8TDY3_9AGAM|nr:putative thioredoxin [Artomyces pyxidatus]
MPVEDITSAEEFYKIITSNKVSIFDFWATWCGPCRMISPIFEKLSSGDTSSDIGFYKVDVDEQGDLSEEQGVRALPIFIALKKGKKIGQVIGANPQRLQQLVRDCGVTKT